MDWLHDWVDMCVWVCLSVLLSVLECVAECDWVCCWVWSSVFDWVFDWVCLLSVMGVFGCIYCMIEYPVVLITTAQGRMTQNNSWLMNVRQLQREHSPSTSAGGHTHPHTQSHTHANKSPKTPHKLHNKNLDGARGSVSPVKQRPSERDGILSPKNVIVEVCIINAHSLISQSSLFH